MGAAYKVIFQEYLKHMREFQRMATTDVSKARDALGKVSFVDLIVQYPIEFQTLFDFVDSLQNETASEPGQPDYRVATLALFILFDEILLRNNQIPHDEAFGLHCAPILQKISTVVSDDDTPRPIKITGGKEWTIQAQ